MSVPVFRPPEGPNNEQNRKKGINHEHRMSNRPQVRLRPARRLYLDPLLRATGIDPPEGSNNEQDRSPMRRMGQRPHRRQAHRLRRRLRRRRLAKHRNRRTRMVRRRIRTTDHSHLNPDRRTQVGSSYRLIGGICGRTSNGRRNDGKRPGTARTIGGSRLVSKTQLGDVLTINKAIIVPHHIIASTKKAATVSAAVAALTYGKTGRTSAGYKRMPPRFTTPAPESKFFL